jgi:hypothetical protein
MRVVRNGSRRQADVGVILLDVPRFNATEKLCLPGDAGPGNRPVGFLSNPASWNATVLYRVARGCTPEDSAKATQVARSALAEACASLDGRVDVITTDCAYTWFVHDSLHASDSALLPSSLQFLDIAHEMTGDVVLVVSDASVVKEQLEGLRPELRLVELLNYPEWGRFHHGTDGLEAPLRQTLMAQELREALAEDLSANGRPGVCVLECTGLPQFRDVVRSVYCAPVFDVAAMVHAVLGAEPPHFESFPT